MGDKVKVEHNDQLEPGWTVIIVSDSDDILVGKETLVTRADDRGYETIKENKTVSATELKKWNMKQ